MNDINHWFSNDVSTSNSGDLAISSKVTLTQQRIIRRVLTNPATGDAPPDYIWNPGYGCGAANYVGETSAKLSELKARIIGQLQQEPGVSQATIPDVTFNSSNETLYITISYIDSSNGSKQVLTFDTGGAN